MAAKTHSLEKIFASKGFKYPDGLNHVLFHYGDGRKQVYKYLYGMLHFGNKIGSEGQTLVYPIEVRDAVRTRFPGDTQGKNDEQYQRDGPKVYHVTMKEMAEAKYRPPPKGCKQCQNYGKKPY